jgi:hypothetical protein
MKSEQQNIFYMVVRKHDGSLRIWV